MDNRLSSAPFTSENHDDMMHLPAHESRWSCSDDCVKVCQERINIRWSLPIMRHTVVIHPDIDHQHHRYEEDESVFNFNKVRKEIQSVKVEKLL